MVLEFAEKRSLHDLIVDQFQGLSHPKFTARVALEIAEAMKFLHDSGIANQDLKSQNVLVSKEEKIKRTIHKW